jgi:uroporphyrinogen III methyltransferase/synthase
MTRPDRDADPVVAALEAVGYRVHAVPMVARQPLHFDQSDLAGYDWVVVTSAAGVDTLTKLPAGPRWAAVGPATARALQARGVAPAFVPDKANGLALADFLPDAHGKRVLLVRASAAAADLASRLRQRGAAVHEIAAYLTIEGPTSAGEPLKAALADVDLAAIIFASGSAVRGFIALGGTAASPAITIGPRTSALALELGFDVIAEAERQSAQALVAAVLRAIPIEETNIA